MASAKERPNAALPDGEVLPQTGGEFPATRARFKHPSMDVNYKRKECLWSKSPGYFFFLATLRPPPQLLLGTSYYRRWTNHRGLWMTVANERLVYTCRQIMCVHNYISTWWVGPRHQNIISGVRASLAVFFFFLLILTTSILVSVNVALRCWQRWLLKLCVFFKGGVIYSSDNFI